MFVLHILLGWFLADLGTACIHLFMDRVYGTRLMRVPYLGMLIRDFEEHHRIPPKMLEGSWWYTSRENVIGATLLLPLFALWPSWLLGTFLVGMAVSQQTHKWSHMRPVPRLVRPLQALYLSLPPAEHHKHHAGFSRNYSVLCGWSNPVLNTVLTLVGA